MKQIEKTSLKPVDEKKQALSLQDYLSSIKVENLQKHR